MEPMIKSTDSISEFAVEFDVNRIKTEPSFHFDDDNDNLIAETEELDPLQMDVVVKQEPELHIVDVRANVEADDLGESRTDAKRFKCKYCDQKFNRRFNATVHERTHTGEKPFACDKCPMRFVHNNSLNRHKLTHSGVKRFECEVCLMRFVSRENLAKHMTCVHSEERPFPCHFCPMSFKLKRYLVEHIKQHKSENKSCPDDTTIGIVCDECQMVFPSIVSLNIHRRCHLRNNHQGKHFRCDICSMDFSIRTQYIKHMNSHEPGSLQCKQCPMRFSRRKEFLLHTKSHKTTESTSDGLFTCDLCQNSYATKVGLIHHMKNHSAGAYTKCEICGKKCHISNIKRHMKSHNDQKTMKCKECTAVFKYSSQLNLHKKSHLNEAFLRSQAQIGALDDDEDFVNVVKVELI